MFCRCVSQRANQLRSIGRCRRGIPCNHAVGWKERLSSRYLTMGQSRPWQPSDLSTSIVASHDWRDDPTLFSKHGGPCSSSSSYIMVHHFISGNNNNNNKYRRPFSSTSKEGGEEDAALYLLTNMENTTGEWYTYVERHAQLMQQIQSREDSGACTRRVEEALVNVLHSIGLYHWETSNMHASKAAYEEALHRLLSLHTFQGENEAIATTLHFLGSIHARLAEEDSHDDNNSSYTTKEEAMKWYSKALEMKRKVYDPCHPEVGKTMNGIAMLYAPPPPRRGMVTTTSTTDTPSSTMEDVDRARALFREAEQIFRDSYSDDHPYVAHVCENLGRLYALAGHAKDALQEYSEVLRIKRLHVEMGAMEPNDPSLATLHAAMGDCMFDMKDNDFEGALSMYEQALGIHKSLLKEATTTATEDITSGTTSDGNEAMAILYHKIGLTYSRMSKMDMSLAQLEESLRLKKKLAGDDHFEVAVTLNCMGAIYGTKGDRGRALSFFRESLRIFKLHAVTDDNVLVENDPNVLNALSNIAILERSSR